VSGDGARPRRLTGGERGSIAAASGAAAAGIWFAVLGPGPEARFLGVMLALACALDAWQVTIAAKWRRAWQAERDRQMRRTAWREN
jgi:hypothetical protein